MVVLADTSVWVDVLKSRDTPQSALFHRASINDDIVVGDLVIAEVLQGIREEHLFRTILDELSAFQLVTLCGPELAVRAAANYRLLRSRGITVRGTIDVIIATWCIENDVAIIHNDRDMRIMEEQLGLRAYA